MPIVIISADGLHENGSVVMRLYLRKCSDETDRLCVGASFCLTAWGPHEISMSMSVVVRE